MIDAIAQLVAAGACIVILVRSEPAINRMRWGKTPILIMVSFWCLAVGAAGGIVEILYGYIPPLPVVLGGVGVAALLVCERRIRYLSRQPAKAREV